MRSADLDKVIEEVRALTPEHQRMVRDLIDSLLEGEASFTLPPGAMRTTDKLIDSSLEGDASLTLPPGAIRTTNELIDSSLDAAATPVALSPEDLLERRLLERGVISAIPRRDFDPNAYEEFVPVEVKGKPLSETIIEERR